MLMASVPFGDSAGLTFLSCTASLFNSSSFVQSEMVSATCSRYFLSQRYFKIFSPYSKKQFTLYNSNDGVYGKFIIFAVLHSNNFITVHVLWEENTWKRELWPELDIGVKGYIPELLALAIRAHWIVAEDVQDVVMTSSESVQAAVFFRRWLENLHEENQKCKKNHKNITSNWGFSVQKILLVFYLSHFYIFFLNSGDDQHVAAVFNIKCVFLCSMIKSCT